MKEKLFIHLSRYNLKRLIKLKLILTHILKIINYTPEENVFEMLNFGKIFFISAISIKNLLFKQKLLSV